MLVNVRELKGRQLDCAIMMARARPGLAKMIADGTCRFSPSTDWSIGGPLLHEFGFNIINHKNKSMLKPAKGEEISAQLMSETMYGETELIASGRLIVALSYGDTIELPDFKD